jgi:GT2 family glycosyltransferase
MFCELGGFDALFHPFYWEDVDLGVRARERGWDIYYEPECRIIHHFGGTIQSSSRASEIAAIKARNRLLFAWRHRRGAMSVAHHLFLIGRILTSWMAGDWTFYRGLALAIERRHLVKKLPESIVI